MENHQSIGAEIRGIFSEFQQEQIELEHFTPKLSNWIDENMFSSDRATNLVDETPGMVQKERERKLLY